MSKIFTGNEIWVTRDQKRLKVKNMTTAHILNACKMLCRLGSELLLDRYGSALANTNGNYYAEVHADCIGDQVADPVSCWHAAIKERPVGRALKMELQRRNVTFTPAFH